MRKLLITAVLSLGLLTGAFWGGMALGENLPEHTTGSMLQKDFPCQEDEALVYDSKFGPDKVGCVNIEQLTSH
jgi:Gene product 79